MRIRACAYSGGIAAEIILAALFAPSCHEIACPAYISTRTTVSELQWGVREPGARRLDS
jgi:hypothetical protein